MLLCSFMLIKEAHRQGYKLDYSNDEYDGCVGMLCYIPFTIKKYTAVKKSLESKFNNRLDKIEKLELLVTGFGILQKPVEILLNGKTPVIKDTETEKDIAMKINKAQFLEKLKNLNLALWYSDYCDNTVDDGTQWEFKIYYTDGKMKKYTGSNDYPAEFNSLCHLFRLNPFDSE